MKQILFATTNKGKLGQFQYTADHFQLDVQIISLYEKFPHIQPYSEEYESIEQIVRKGSEEIFDQVKEPVVVEDSIFQVFALNNRPGLGSADYLKNRGRHELLVEMQKASDRSAQMISCVAVRTDKDYKLFKNILSGKVAAQEKFKQGEPLWISPTPDAPYGGGYGPIFIPAEPGDKTLAELPASEHITHGSREPNFKRALDYLLYYVGI